MICLFARRRLGAYVDGALDAGASRALGQHLGSCIRCRHEVEGLRQVTLLLRRAMPVAPDPDWTGFWPGIVRGIQDGTNRPPVPARSRLNAGRTWLFGGVAVTAAAALTLVVGYDGLFPPTPEEAIVVTAADTQYPGGTMVYHEPDKVAVVWVFDE